MSSSFLAEASRGSLKWALLLGILIDVPFVAILALSWGELDSIIALIMIIPLGISGLVVYSSYAAKGMTYILAEEGLKVSFPLAPLRLRYNQIRGAGKVETSLGFRLFGGSLPGSHWGTFTTSNLGNVQVYATRASGEFVLLELVDGTKVLISPLDTNGLLDALKGKTAFGAPTLAEVEPPRLDRRLATVQVAVVTIAWLALVAYVASFYPGLPEVIPVHFGLDGAPNRYGSKVEMLILVAFSAIFPAMNAVFALKFGKYNKGLTTFLSAVFLFAVGLFALAFNQILGAI